MYVKASVVVAASVMAGLASSTANVDVEVEPRAVAVTCSINLLARLMQSLPLYAAPFCKAAVNIPPKTPVATITVAPTEIVAATAYSTVYVTDKAQTTSVTVNGKRDIYYRSEQVHDLNNGAVLQDRALLDFAVFASAAKIPLAVAAVSTACSCFSSAWTAPTVTTTVAGKSTVTVSAAKTTLPTTVTIKGATVTVTSKGFVASTTSSATSSMTTTSSSVPAPSSPTTPASSSVVTSVASISSSFVPVISITNSVELASINAVVSSILSNSAPGPTPTGPASGTESPLSLLAAASSTPAGQSTITFSPTATPSSAPPSSRPVCGVDLQPYMNDVAGALPSTFNGCNPDSRTSFSACHTAVNGTAICSSCGKCGTATAVCTSDSQCGAGEACIIGSACAGGAARCMPVNDNCYD